MRKWLLDISLALLMVWSVSILASFLFRADAVEETLASTDAPRTETIGVLIDGSVETMALEEYLVGVLLGEMPADFSMEAKKAQAVVARTYALRVGKMGYKHGEGVVCSDPDCCQNFISVDDYIGKWQTDVPVDAAREAVRATEGIVVTYDGELIDATYFSSSGGQTEAAVAVWGSDIPYLQSVESPGEEESGQVVETVRFSSKEFCDALGVRLEGRPSDWFGTVSHTEGGGVKTMVIGGKAYSGTQLRSLLGLRSTVFTVATVADGVLITSRGFGHRVGMSQYGADAMARQGHCYVEILHHYYSGVEIGHMDSLRGNDQLKAP